MKSVLITDSRDIVTGLRLAGVKGIYCKNKEELKKNLLNTASDKNVGIIILTRGVEAKIEDEILQVKKQKMPLVVTIPDLKNDLEDDFILKYIKDSIGIKISWWGLYDFTGK